MFSRKEEIEELKEALEKIKNKAVIVEGKRDYNVLCLFGFTNVFAINGRSLYGFAENIKEKELIILTDFDSEGERIAKRLTLFLHANSCRINEKLRKQLRVLFAKNKIKHVQDLKKFIQSK